MKKILIQTGREAFFRHVFKVPLTVRITFLLLICVFFQAGAEVVYSQSKRISLDLRNVTVEEALNVIEEQSEFYFLYNTKLIDVDRKVNVKARNQLIFAVLDGMFASTDVAYKVEEKQIILSRKSWDSPVASQQDKTQITGTVTDESGEAVIGANVIEKGTTNGTVTDADGNFALTVANNAILQLSFIGYITQEISV
ncbi:MAG: carboxypeptidase-like regulatory domain-containing protein, partial [Tannerella sp.]|nr:carboxypeptidase-like regulatory domain-containing protein [Tannerella sp.]